MAWSERSRGRPLSFPDPRQHKQELARTIGIPMDFYNGYTPQERAKKLRAMYKQFPGRSHPYFQGPCDMCGDPNSPVAPHTEDYSEPYLWESPAEYAVCNTCHSRIHKRFGSPFAWEAYEMHVRRGGYGADLKSSSLAQQVRKLAQELKCGRSLELEKLRESSSPDAWWEKLETDPKTQTDTSSRPR